jgi:hypothetical protein
MADETYLEHLTGVKSQSRGPDRLIAELAGRQHGLVARRQLLAAGIRRGSIGSRLERGALHAVHRGVYAVGHPKMTTEGRWMAAVLVGGDGTVLSHRSAGQLWGLIRHSPLPPEVTRPEHFKSRSGLVGHHASLPPDETGRVLGIPVTSAPRTLFDLASLLSGHQLERAFNEAEVQRLVDRLSLPELIARYPRHRGLASLRGLLDAKTPRGITRSRLEERFVAFLDTNGLPRPHLNAGLTLRGRFFEVDCLWRARRLVVELDGRGFHDTGRAFEMDRERDRILLAEGWRVTRVTWRQLDEETASVAADLREMLRFEAGRPTLR